MEADNSWRWVVFIKGIFFGLLIFWFMPLLWTACTRAIHGTEDRIVGVILTHWNTARDLGRIYAEMPDELSADFSFMDAFGDIEIWAYMITVSRPSMSRTYASETVRVNEVSIGRLFPHDNDAPSIEMDGTVYGTDAVSAFFSWTPVFQDSHGRVYIAHGGGGISVGRLHGTSHVQFPIGNDFSNISLSVRGIRPADKIVVVQMDAEHNLISLAEYPPGELTDAYLPGEDTMYLIVETIAGNNVTRTIFNRWDDRFAAQLDSFDSFYVLENGFAIPRATEVRWQG